MKKMEASPGITAINGGVSILHLYYNISPTVLSHLYRINENR